MISLENAVVWDTESFPNIWTLQMEMLNSDIRGVFEISEYRDDRHLLRQWLNWLNDGQVPMIGYNSEGYDYPILHHLWMNPSASYAELYAKSKSMIGSDDRFGHTIWPRDRLAPQIDLYKVHHLDNRAKATSLKALQFAMRSKTIVESAVPFDSVVTAAQVEGDLIPYGVHDTAETKQFALYSMDALNFRVGLVDQFGVECLSWNDTKIGEKMLEQRLGDDVCYERDPITNRRSRRQTVRHQIALRDIIFPWIQFNNPEFQRIHAFMLAQVLKPDEIGDPDGPIKTKGVFTDLSADVGGIRFDFGTGGVHASVENKVFAADQQWMIRDIDVAALYPSIAVVNGLAPAHLGNAFVTEYAKLPVERAKHAKGTVQNAAFKLAANGAYGKSNSVYSFLYDPQFTLQITINGQLMLCMLAEWLLTVPSVSICQVNTDGITYMIRRDMLDKAQAVEQRWQDYTNLKLEDAEYTRMWLADVNSYVAEDIKGKLKTKGRYWAPDPLNYAHSISTASPPAWHRDLSALIVPRAAVMQMVHGVPIEATIRCHTDPFDFCLRAKVGRSDTLLIGQEPQQRVTRYYVARDGAPMVKVSPPVAGGVIGQWKRANGISKAEYDRVMAETGGAWDERVCTKNRSRYEERRTAIQAGYVVRQCNDIDDFSFDNLNYDFYISEARKLIIG